MTDRVLPRTRLDVNGISMTVHDAGEGPPVLLLHGFPDSADLWRHQIEALVGAGYRCVAPDLRGFGESDRPEGLNEYAIPVVLEDLRALLAVLGLDRVRLVTHDWGAVVGWLFAAAHPEIVQRLVAFSVGYQKRRPAFEQLEKYWYIFLWQLEGVAERVIAADDWWLMREWLRGGRPGETPDLERNLADLARPGALTAGLSWYRAIGAPEAILEAELPVPPVEVPVMGVWAEHDILPEERMLESEESVTGGWRYERLDGVGHWMMLEAPGRVNALLVDFLAG